MTTTYVQLRTKVATDLGDPNNKTFLDPVVGDMVNAAIVELGRIAPLRFQEDVTPVADTLDYILQSSVFDAPQPEIEVKRVELWDGATTPPSFRRLLQAAQREFVDTTAAGWTLWNGVLSLTNAMETSIDPDRHLLRVWGYRPFATLAADDDVSELSVEIEQAARDYCRVKALERLVADRSLFSQWQTRSNNTDISPAQLINDLSLAQESWRRKSRALYIPRA